MLIFNCSEAASDFFTTVRKGVKLSPLSPKPKSSIEQESSLHDLQYWNWMIHVKKFGSKNVLLAMDTDSRFCMLFWGLKKGDTEGFLRQFNERLSLHMVTFFHMCGHEEATLNISLEKFFANHSDYAFVKRGDRSVQTHINAVFLEIQYEQYRWEDKIPTEEELFISDFDHNDTYRKRKFDKDYIKPTEELLHTLLSVYANLDESAMKKAFNQYHQAKKQLWEFPLDIELDFEAFESAVEAPSDNVISLNDYINQKKEKNKSS